MNAVFASQLYVALYIFSRTVGGLDEKPFRAISLYPLQYSSHGDEPLFQFGRDDDFGLWSEQAVSVDWFTPSNTASLALS